jgi:hypothetical protein
LATNRIEGYRETKRNKLNKSQQNQLSENNTTGSSSNSSLEEIASLQQQQQQPQPQTSKLNSTIGIGKESLSTDQKKHLDDIMSYLNNTSNDSSKFVKLAPNQTKILKVLTDKTELVDVSFPSDPKTVVKRCRFTVYDMVADEVGGKLRPSGDTTKEFTTSTSLAKNIIQLNQKGFTTVEILRTGEGLATKYVVTPVVE